MSHESVIERSRRICDLADDWDGEGSPGYAVETWERATAFLRAIVARKPTIPSPIISPAENGSVDLFWSANGQTLLVNFSPDREAVFAGRDAGGAIRGDVTAESPADFAAWLIDAAPEHPERAPAPELIRGEAPTSRSIPQDVAAAALTTPAAPTGAAAPTPAEAYLKHRHDCEECPGGWLGLCPEGDRLYNATLAASPAGRARKEGCDHFTDESCDTYCFIPREERAEAMARDGVPAGRAPTDEDRPVIDDCLDGICSCPPESGCPAWSAAGRGPTYEDEGWASSAMADVHPPAAGRAPARAGTTPELIEAWQALAEYRALVASLRAEVSRLSADRAGGA